MGPVIDKSCFSSKSLTMQEPMPKFVTIGYGDEAGYVRTDERVRSEAHAQDARLGETGVVMG
jgi:hypothetical protein